MFPYKTANNIEQQERKADITYLDAQLSLKANLAGATLTGAYQFTAGWISGENTVDLTGIDVNGTIYDAYAQVTNVGTAHEAQLILNRHSTTLPARIVGARSNSETTAHTAVTTGQELLSLWGVGITSASGHHDIFGTMDFVVGTGTVSATSSPGKWVLKLTPDGAQTPAEVLSIDSDGSAAFAGSVTFASASFTAVSLADGSAAAPSLRHTGDTNTGLYFSLADNVDFSCGGVNALNLKATAAVFAGSITTTSLILGATTVTASGTELNYVDGVTSPIQTQLDDRVFVSGDTMTGALGITVGLVSAPGLFFSGDTNTGIYSSAADNVDFSCGGVNALNLKATAAVFAGSITTTSLILGATTVTASGIELNYVDGVTSSIQTQLDDRVFVSGDTMTGVLGIIAGAVSAPGLFFSGDTNTGIYSSAADNVNITCGGTAMLYASVTGVGIGATPSYRLHVVGASNASAVYVRVEGDLPDNEDNAGLYVYHAGTGGTAFRMRTDSAVASSYFVDILVNNAAAGPNTALYVRHRGTNDIQRWSGSNGAGGDTERLRLTNSGNLALSSAGKIFLDGVAASGDTYIYESSANVVDVYAGAARGLTITASGFGYATGVGGTVTQATSKSTGVTLSKVCGAITMDAAALAADAIVSFVLTNTVIAATDVLVLNHISGGTPGAYTLNARAAAGSATIDVANRSAGSLSEAIVIQFAVIKAVNA